MLDPSPPFLALICHPRAYALELHAVGPSGRLNDPYSLIRKNSLRTHSGSAHAGRRVDTGRKIAGLWLGIEIRAIADFYRCLAASPDEEADMLRRFWDDIQKLSNQAGQVQWITCNGKRFSAPFLSARSVRHGITPTNSNILDTHKYRNGKHLDPANVWDAPWYGLADLCDHLGVDSPKGEFDGSDVAPAIENGNSEKVRRYCERDAVATFRCAQALQAVV